jgi:hypothetical protein
MAEGATGQPPSAGTAGGNDANQSKNDEGKQQHRGRRGRHRTNRPKWKDGGNNAAHIPKEKFEGRSDDLKGFTYDVASSKGGVAYMRTTEEIARYVGEKYTTIGSFIRKAILTLNVPAPARPVAPVATGTPPVVDSVDQEIFKEKIRMYVKIEASIETTMKSLYDLLWGQCSETIRSRLRGHDDYTAYSVNADSMALLKAIRAEMTGFRDKQYLSHALHKIMGDFYTLGQGKHRSNQEYYDKFNSLIKTATESGTSIGAHPAGILAVLSESATDPDQPTPEEMSAATKTASEWYLAVAFLLGADKTRYGLLVEEIENEYLRNKGSSAAAGTYPTSVAEAHDYLCGYRKDPKNIARLLGQHTGGDHNPSSGVAFVQDGGQQKNDPDNPGSQEQAFATHGGSANTGNP